MSEAMPDAMIVAAQPEAAEAGARVLKAGGNAIDAAMAAALVQGVVDPQMCGIGGFGNCQIYMPGKGVHTCLDFHGKTPLAAKPVERQPSWPAPTTKLAGTGHCGGSVLVGAQFLAEIVG